MVEIHQLTLKLFSKTTEIAGNNGCYKLPHTVTQPADPNEGTQPQKIHGRPNCNRRSSLAMPHWFLTRQYTLLPTQSAHCVGINKKSYIGSFQDSYYCWATLRNHCRVLQGEFVLFNERPASPYPSSCLCQIYVIHRYLNLAQTLPGVKLDPYPFPLNP